MKHAVMRLVPPLSSSTGGKGPSRIRLDPEGGAGGDQDGGSHGDGLPGVLDAVRLIRSLGGQQPRADF